MSLFRFRAVNIHFEAVCDLIVAMAGHELGCGMLNALSLDSLSCYDFWEPFSSAASQYRQHGHTLV